MHVTNGRPGQTRPNELVSKASNARGPLALVLLSVVPVGLWATAGPLGHRFDGSTLALGSLGVVFGLVGLCLFALNIILGARLRFITSFFGGLERMYLVHRVNGRVAFALLAAHALLIVASRATRSIGDATTLFDPGNLTVFLGVLAFLFMTASIGFTLYARLGHEAFVYVQRSFGLAFVLGGLHAFRTPGIKALSGGLTPYLAALFGLALVAYAYRSVFGNVLVRRYDYTVTRVAQLDDYVTEITLKPQGRSLRFIPGQFLFVTFYSDAFNAQFHPFSMSAEETTAIVSLRPGDVRNQFHPFSITSSAEEFDLRVAVKAVGDYTTAMRNLDVGAAARIEGPYGSFSYLNAANRRQVWLAGGIGITPFLSMARSLGDDHEIHLIHGVKTRAQAYFFDELHGIATSRAGFHFRLIPEDEQGLITVDLLEEEVGSLQDTDYLICGPPVMIDAISSRLVEKGIPRARIHFERFGFGPRN
jgi:predicted ferric reductase